ncbi:zinc transporter ZIP4-like [Gigantopelta aegis]|uniref:zinc transporter ZIP4-like n=1 Tax=Gigantopelta aegis TaxID=1735272 RepID=UPI001B88AC37|nr:zinc transporter ZIP4-like [Gigantopelta aegis]
MKVFFHERHHNISVKEFHEVCPALLHHLLFATSQFGSSRPRPSASKPTPIIVTPSHANLTALKHAPTNAQVYGYGSLSVLLISLCSVVGALFIKISKGVSRHYIMAGMLALGMGNLCGDAVLHLLPEIITAEKIGTDNEEDKVMLLGNADIPRHCIRMLAMLASIYGFFVLELAMSLYHDHSHESEIEVTVDSSKSKSNVSRITLVKFNNTASSGSLSTIYEDGLETPSTSSSQPGVMDIEHEVDNPMKTVKKTSSLSVKVPRSVAWMIIVGDSVHNFADGLAIGAAFSLSVTTGVSTSIAVICHELPHELGDFAVLISTGMSVKRALWLNFVSSLTAFVGLYIGISAGAQDTARHWIFSVGAGMFIYVALADLIPELLRYFKRFQNWAMFLVQNVGILAGYAIMLIIAIYEDEINI